MGEEIKQAIIRANTQLDLLQARQERLRQELAESDARVAEFFLKVDERLTKLERGLRRTRATMWDLEEKEK